MISLRSMKDWILSSDCAHYKLPNFPKLSCPFLFHNAFNFYMELLSGNRQIKHFCLQSFYLLNTVAESDTWC